MEPITVTAKQLKRVALLSEPDGVAHLFVSPEGDLVAEIEFENRTNSYALSDDGLELARQ
jgi:hypothetical protein